MLGQSMEAATKGMARGAGVSHEEVTKQGHNYFESFLVLQDTMYRKIGIAREVIDELDRQRTLRKWPVGGISELRILLERCIAPSSRKWKEVTADERKNAREFFSSMLLLSPESVSLLMNTWRTLNNRCRSLFEGSEALLKEKLGREIVLSKPAPREDFLESICDQVIIECETKLFGAQVDQAQREHIKSVIKQNISNDERRLAQELKESNWKVKTDSILGGLDARMLVYDVPLANVGLFLFGLIAWPHSHFVRYPAAPDAPVKFADAAKDPTNGKLGTSHYSDEVGAIKHITMLTSRAIVITRTLNKACQDGYLVPQEPYAHSE